MHVLGDFTGFATTVLLYLMLAVPFAVWTGRAAYGRTVGKDRTGRRYPGRWPSFWLAGLPAILLGYFALRGFDSPDPSAPGMADEWGQVYFIMVPACLGMIAGFAVGTMMAWRRQEHG